MSKIEKHKPKEEWSVDETIAFARTGEKPVSPDYLEAKAEALRAGGFDEDDDALLKQAAPVALQDMSPEDHAKRKYGGGKTDSEKVDPEKEDPESKVDPEDETRAKKAEREAKEAQEKLTQREAGDQSEQEKAIAAAEKKGRETAETEGQKERKADRLEVAVTRLASKKIKVGEGDDAEEMRFADTEDALLNIERLIARGEIDEEDIFDKEGKVKTDALQSELADLLKRKPHLKDGGTEESTGPKGDPDSRKGDPAKTDLDSPEGHAKRKYGDRK